MRKTVILVTIAFTVFGMFTFETQGKLAANKLAANKLDPFSAAANSAAANRLANHRLAVWQTAPDRFIANPNTTQEFMATELGREVFGFIVSCALPEGSILVATGADGTEYEYFGELNLARGWLNHRLRKAGRGWISACLFSRINESSVPLPISLRGQNPQLASSPEERSGWTLQEGAFYGDYFVAPGEPVQWIACRGRDQAMGETGGLIERDCTEPDPDNPGFTKCGFTYAGDCGNFSLTPVCDSESAQGFYRNCQDAFGDESESDSFRQVITVFAAP